MKQRRYILTLLWVAPLIVIAAYWGHRQIRSWAATGVVRAALAAFTGAEVTVHRVSERDGRMLLSRVRIGTGPEARFSCEAAEFAADGWPLVADATGRIDARACTADYRDCPPIRLDRVSLAREKADGGARRIRLSARTACSTLNSFLEKKGRVRFERGELELYCYPRAKSGRLDFPVHLVLRDFRVRGLDGRFEAEGEEARVTVRVSGEPGRPRLELGELEPYFGGEFARSLGELAR